MVILGNKPIDLNDFEKIVLHKEPVEIDPQALSRCNENHEFLKNFSDKKIIYGINTGFGPMAQYRIEDSQKTVLQLNLIRSHCTGSGTLLPDSVVRSILLSRLNTLLLGFSGIHESVFHLLAYFLNNNIHPHIYEHGSVGASGDLVQLAQVALNLIGEGRCQYNNETKRVSDVFDKLHLAPIKIVAREGLAIINGTAGMTGIGLINIIRAKQLTKLGIMATCLINEVVNSFDDHFAQPLNEVKKHYGQKIVASYMREYLTDSKCIRKRDNIYYNNIPHEYILSDKVQEYYSLRCVPQILGPVWDTIEYANNILISSIS